MSASGISVIGRNTQGMRIMKVKGNDKVTGTTKVLSEKEEENVLEEGEKQKEKVKEAIIEKTEEENVKIIEKDMDFIDKDTKED